MASQLPINDEHWLYSTHFNDPTLSDLTLKLSDSTTVNAHRVILCRRSKYFTKLLTGGFSETDSKQIEFGDDEPTAVFAMLRFLYGLPYPADEVHWHDGKTILPHAQVYTVAEKYEMENLKVQVHQNMIKLIQFNGDKPDLIDTIREIITQTPETDTMARKLLVDHCVEHLSYLSRQADFVTLLEECGSLGAAVITTQQAGN